MEYNNYRYMKSLFIKPIDLILQNEPVIVPTDTVYGLVCRYDSKSAVSKIYKFKKRERKKPLILLGYNWKALRKFVSVKRIPQATLKTLKSKWPGPLTIIFPASKAVPSFLNKGYKTVGIRVPGNKFLLKLLNQCPEKVLASTSANISGKSDKKPQKELVKNVKLFIKAKKKEMSLKPSTILKVDKNGNIERVR